MIEKMKSVSIVAKASQKNELLLALRDMGVMHIAEKKTADDAVLERFSVISRLLTELGEYVTDGDEASEALSDDQFEEVYRNSLSALEKKQMLEGKRLEISLELERLKAWGEFDSRLVRELEGDIELHFYRVDKKTYRELSVDESVKFIRLSPVDQMDAIAVVGELDSSVTAMEFSIPERGTVELREELERIKSEIDGCTESLKVSAKHLMSYSEQLLKTKNDAEYSAVSKTVDGDGSIVWISGYIPCDDVQRFEAVAKEKKWAWAMEDVLDNDENVPTKIRHTRLTALIKPVFDILGVVPGYREYDISFWFLAFFGLFFAMIIGDAGYGALFLIGTVAFNIKTKKVTNVILLLYLLSSTTIIWGALTGTWFGLEGAMNIPLLKSLVIPGIANYPEYFGVETVTTQNNVMKFSFSIGVIQLALACIMNIRRKIAERSLAFVADIGWFASITAIYLLVLNLVIGDKINFALVATVIGVGFVLVMLFGGMSPDKSFSKGLKAGLADTFTVFLNTISAFGNIMSYIRLFAVGMASLAIAQSFNGMAEGFSGPLVIVGALIMIVGHALNIVMGFLSVVVHGVRLNLLEFSGQLGMEWSGIAYEPFKKIKK